MHERRSAHVISPSFSQTDTRTTTNSPACSESLNGVFYGHNVYFDKSTHFVKDSFIRTKHGGRKTNSRLSADSVVSSQSTLVSTKGEVSKASRVALCKKTSFGLRERNKAFTLSRAVHRMSKRAGGRVCFNHKHDSPALNERS